MALATHSAVAVLACLIDGFWAIRISDDLQQQFDGNQYVYAEAGHGSDLSFLDRGCEVDFTEEHTTEQEEEEEKATSLALVSEVFDPIKKNEYWEPANALARCSTGRTLRMVKLIVGVPVAVIAGNFVAIHVVVSGTYGGIVSSVMNTIGTPVSTVVTSFLTNVASPLAQLTLRVPLYFAKGLMLGVIGALSSVVMTAGAVFIVPIPFVALVTPVLATMSGFEVLTSYGVDVISRVFGRGGNKTAVCCCLPGQEANATAEDAEPCVLVSSRAGASQCPSGWEHKANACPTDSPQSFSKTQTVEGCQCKTYDDCGSNKFYQGHAWCELTPKSETGVESKMTRSYKACGTRYRLSRTRRWDYCRNDGNPLAFALGETTSNEDALATFLPNRFTRSTTSKVYTFGTWVDESRGIVTASGPSGTQCFAATPMEFLEDCARACLTEGAPTANTLNSKDELKQNCSAFAYNRQLHLCLRLPDFAADARLPYFSSVTNDGWQSFVSKYEEAKGSKGVCSAEVIHDIGAAGFTIVRDKNNGHLYVECVGSENLQKVSCLQDECGQPGWCFVKNHCRKGVWKVFGGCTKLSHEESLKCAGENGAVPGGDPPTNYWDVRNSVARCKSSGRKRMIKVVAVSAMMLVAGELITVNIVNQGVIYNFAVNTFSKTFLSIGQVFYDAGMLLSPLIELIMTFTAKLFILIQFALITAFVGIASVYVGTAFAIALTPAAAAVLTPFVLAFAGIQHLSQKTAHLASNLLAFGNHHPKCCCKTVEQKNEDNETISQRSCGTFSPVDGSVPSCPAEFDDSLGDGCDISEVFQFTENQTLQGCQCKEYDDCKKNAPHQGHAWCHTSEKCGYRSIFGGRWDHCLFSDKLVNETSGETLLPANEYDLKNFIPNRFSRIDLFGAAFPLTLGTYTDSSYRLTTAKPPKSGFIGNTFDKRECFVAMHRETLGACAKACKREGAISAANNTYNCAAFAWHPEDRLCVRLPIFAADSKYTPFLKQWGGRGWQNFISKFVAGNGKQACPAATYVEMRNAGFAIARDKNNGHMYLRCQGQQGAAAADTQKASCIAKECDGQPWCLVKNHCGGLFRRCRRLPTSEPQLKCIEPVSEPPSPSSEP